MIAEVVIAAALVFSGRTAEGRPLRVERSGDRVTRVRGSVVAYECEKFGDVGPISFDVRVRVRPDRRGRFSFVTGERAQREGIAGYVEGRRIRGRVRISGTIATGERCVSPLVRFRAYRR